jgi:hypothetical protein
MNFVLTMSSLTARRGLLHRRSPANFQNRPPEPVRIEVKVSEKGHRKRLTIDGLGRGFDVGTLNPQP